ANVDEGVPVTLSVPILSPPVSVDVPETKLPTPLIEKIVPGELVPIPTLPLPCCTSKLLLPITNPPSAKVEVALVEVAVRYATVGDDVATSFPVESVERSALVIFVNQTVELAVNCEVEAFVKFCVAVHQLECARF